MTERRLRRENRVLQGSIPVPSATRPARAEQQLLLAMQYNPDLKQAFVAMQDSRSNEDKVAMARDFQVRVQSICGDQSQQTNNLLTETAKALGLAVSGRIQDQASMRPQQVILQQVPPPERPE
jgi:hypothetical protein